ncbi:cardiotrophin-2 [Tenrec ecaudatus]|uniref:cardiotrophin-2 n=1 Tax=Tenrec ecaudatus TaxID=94439 RepID=UPI003F5A8315
MNGSPSCPETHLTRVPGAISPFSAAPGGSAAIGGGGAGRRGAWNAQNAGVHGPPRALGPSLRRRPGRRRVELGGAGGEALPRAAARPFQGEVLLRGAQSLSPPRPAGAPRSQVHCLIATPLCLMTLLMPPFCPAAPISPAEPIKQAYSLALYMQKNTSTLLQTYLQYQGSPFSDPGFSAPELQLSSLPPAAVSFKTWHALEDAERLVQAQEAFLALTQHLQLVGDDQIDLNPGSPILLAQLGAARLRAQGLLGNMAAIMTALGLPIPPEEDTLGLVPFGASAFERKCRGYVVTREYGHWTDRAVRDLALLKAKYPA